MKNRLKLIKSVISISLLINGISLGALKLNSPMKVKGLEHILNLNDDSLNLSSKQTEMEFYTSFNQFQNIYENCYLTSDCNNHYNDLSVDEIINTINNNSVANELTSYGEIILKDQGQKLLKEAITYFKSFYSYFNSMFIHNLQELKVFESNYYHSKQKFGVYMEGLNSITMYPESIKEYVKKTMKEGDDFNTLYEREYKNTLIYLLTQVYQKKCSCILFSQESFFGNSTLFKGAIADIPVFQGQLNNENLVKNYYGKHYPAEQKIYEKLKMITFFSTSDLFLSLYNSDLSGLYKLFFATTDKEKRDVYELLKDIQETTGPTLNKKLLQAYINNLEKFCLQNNIPMEENIYFFKMFFEKIVDEEKNNYDNNQLFNHYQDLLKKYIANLSKLYGKEEDTILKKINAIDIYHEQGNKVKGIVPVDTLIALGYNEKLSYLYQIMNLAEEDIFYPVSEEFYQNNLNFGDANQIFKMLKK